MKAKQVFYGLLGLVVVMLVGGLAAFGYSHRQIDKKIHQLNRLNSDLVLESQEIDRLKKLEAQYKQIEPLAEKASSVLPTQKEQDQVVAQVAQIASRSGLELSGLTFEKTAGLPDARSQTQSSKIGGILLMPVHFQTIGTYSELQNMLTSFEKQQRFMRVNTLDLSRGQDGLITAGIVLEVFLKP